LNSFFGFGTDSAQLASLPMCGKLKFLGKPIHANLRILLIVLSLPVCRIQRQTTANYGIVPVCQFAAPCKGANGKHPEQASEQASRASALKNPARKTDVRTLLAEGRK